ncbi:MAG: GatB/YqeY domain-containing protein [Eubacteriales bacterium]|nr:GatB/YqeY domain-containing protein [Eubacteriales bacterium]MDD3199635.1 GatB/YqeY domain-containing protein [Eubacteriales bacterium]MDD4122039.1 GatB/YqeY domain-containing protein [Eubacteriales bacterium]MDD4629902.1 GatB/YqeY domain-containing protein [Eubacteriales bacterium]
MSLKDRLLNDFKESMKAKDDIRKNTVNLARAAIKQYEVDHRVELNDQDIIAILTKQVKMRKDALSDFEKAGRTDLLDDYNKEIAILQEYLPKQLSKEEIEAIVKTTAAELKIEGGKQNMGKLIGAVMPKVKGVADGNEVRAIIEELLR